MEEATMLPTTHEHLSMPPLHAALEPYRAELEQAMEPAWLLNAYNADTVSRAETQFLGTTPYVPASEGWPRCKQCGQMLEFVCQINFAEFAGSGMFVEHGLFQFFYCWECFPITHEEVAAGAALQCRWYPQFDECDAEDTEHAVFVATDDRYPYDTVPKRVRPTPFLSFPDLFNSDHPLASIKLNLGGDDEDDVELLGEWAELSDQLKQLLKVLPGSPVEVDGEREFDVQRSLLPTKDYISQLGGYPVWIQT